MGVMDPHLLIREDRSEGWMPEEKDVFIISQAEVSGWVGSLLSLLPKVSLLGIFNLRAIQPPPGLLGICPHHGLDPPFQKCK